MLLLLPFLPHQICRKMPEVMEMYKLDELTTIGTLQHNIKKMFFKNSKR